MALKSRVIIEMSLLKQIWASWKTGGKKGVLERKSNCKQTHGDVRQPVTLEEMQAAGIDFKSKVL